MATVNVNQLGLLVAYSDSLADQTRLPCWTFVLDGHRFYVLSLGPEGDWAYDTTTKEWSQLQSQGFAGLNLIHGIVWNLRVIGGDMLYPQILELDPNQSYDNGFRPVQHIVTGGIPTRSRDAIGVSNFILTASVGDVSSVASPMSLAFSDDNGVSYSPEFTLPLTDIGTQTLIWTSLGSFAAPGRVFRVTDYSGPVRIDGAECVLTGIQDSSDA